MTYTYCHIYSAQDATRREPGGRGVRRPRPVQEEEWRKEEEEEEEQGKREGGGAGEEGGGRRRYNASIHCLQLLE